MDSKLPNRLNIIAANVFVCCDDRHAFHLALRHQQAVERVTMQVGQHVDAQRMAELDRQPLDAVQGQTLRSLRDLLSWQSLPSSNSLFV